MRTRKLTVVDETIEETIVWMWVYPYPGEELKRKRFHKLSNKVYIDCDTGFVVSEEKLFKSQAAYYDKQIESAEKELAYYRDIVIPETAAKLNKLLA